MEGIPSPKSADQSQGLFSCWGRLKLKLPWKRKIVKRYRHIKRFSMRSKSSSAAGFNYDLISYSQNFDEGFDHDDDVQDSTLRGFSARFVTPLSKPLQDV